MRQRSTRCTATLALLLAGCTGHEAPRPLPPAGADAGRGRVALGRFDCRVCHLIPGIRGAPGQVGPSLQHYARRAYVAGKFPNEHTHLVRWIMDPPALAPRTAMPATGVSEAEARDMAAYLLTLR
jgi:cytochrome c2